MPKRIHKVLHHPGRSLFEKHPHGLPSIDKAAKAANPNWSSYDGEHICVDLYELYIRHDSRWPGLPQSVVLRANVQCSCAGACFHSQDHPGHNAHAQAFRGPAIARIDRRHRPQAEHSDEVQYDEAVIDLRELKGISEQAQAAVMDSAVRAQLAEQIKADMDAVDLTAAEIQNFLETSADVNGKLSSEHAVENVLAEKAAAADDYFWTAVLAILAVKVAAEAHSTFAYDLPQRGSGHSIVAS
jgi:hypothetical protein